MAVAERTADRSVRDQVSAEEWQVRVELAAVYRLVAHFGWDDLVFTHASARIPGEDGTFLINPFGLLFEEITASSLVKVDLDGKVVLDNGYSVNEAGFVIHSAVHAARHDVGCVMHTHTRAGMAVSALKEGFLPLTQTSLRVHGHVGYHDYEGPALEMGERARLVENLGAHNALILRNHGLLVCGASVGEAFNLMFYFERACQVQMDVLASNTGYVLPSQDALDYAEQVYYGDNGNSFGFGQTEWPAMLRMLDRQDPSYRD